MSRVYKKSSGTSTVAAPFVMERFGTMKVAGAEVDAEREAYELGFSTGEKAGFELGRKKAEVLFCGLSGVLEEIGSFRENIFEACEGEMVALSLAIAKKLIRREVEVAHEVVVECVKTALKALVSSGEVLIRINPKDLEVIKQHRAEIERYTDAAKGMNIEADPTVERGGALIETNYGEVDATIGGILGEIEEKLQNAE